jgi:hypothetical protein
VSPPAGVAPPLSAPETPIVTEVRRSDANVRLFGDFFDRDLRAVVAGPLKLISSSRGEVELFDLAADPGELENLAAAEPERAAALGERLAAIVRARPPLYDPDARADLSPETEEALRALGYLE